MDRATVSRIEDWESRPVSGGFAGLAELASGEFTGAVTAGGTRLFMLNGRVVGVFDGTMGAFESGEATAYEAPDPSLPLLFAMQEHDGEVQGRYYTDDTPIGEVDGTLSEGGFTGYLELSENVLSGDYYVIYYGGRSLSAAFVGNERRVVTGRDAFELAADEVGIYEVRSVDLDVTDVPEPVEDTAADAEEPAAEPAKETAQETSSPEPDQAPEQPAGDGEEAEADAEPGTGEDADETGPEETPDEAEPSAPVDRGDSSAASGSSPSDEAPTEVEPVPDAEAAPASEPEPESEPEEPADTPGEGSMPEASSPSPSDGHRSAESEPDEGRPPRGEPGVEESDERFREEERWRESRTVPALDPEETDLPEAEASTGASRPAPPEEPATDPDIDDRGQLRALQERVRELEATLESTEEERRRQANRVEDLAAERDEIRAERDELQARIDELEQRLEGAAANQPQPSSARPEPTGRSVDPSTALDQTDLFIRYDSKGKATLQSARDGQADAAEVAENLRIEVHSRFDATGTTVDGQPFEDFLADTIEYRFVAWLVEDLLYEIRDTGSERGLRLLYDSLPNVDRAEFAGTVTLTDEDGEDREIAFDVVCRDRMGKPLIVANINDSLDPATGDMMADLIEDATLAGEDHEPLAAAFLVTASFFQPDALETASGATGGGFLSRDSKKSFVKLARKGGYHLCLAEARGGDFHVAVPEF